MKRATASYDDRDDKILSTKELTARIPFSRQSIWRKVRDGEFPAPIRLGRARIGWRLSRVDAWLAEREGRPTTRRPYFKTDTDKKTA